MLLCLHATGNAGIKIAVTNIPDLLEPESTSVPYSRILLAITSRTLAAESFVFFPAKRSSAYFKDKKSSCLFPSSIRASSNRPGIIESQPINTAKAYFFSQSEITTERILDQSQPPLKIAFQRGNTYAGKIEGLRHHQLIESSENLQMLRMLQRERVDAVIAYSADIQHLVEQSLMKNVLYTDKMLFHEQNDSFICYDNIETARFIAEVDAIIDEMTQTGELKAILTNN